jgi:hypothetical protein
MSKLLSFCHFFGIPKPDLVHYAGNNDGYGSKRKSSCSCIADCFFFLQHGAFADRAIDIIALLKLDFFEIFFYECGKALVLKAAFTKIGIFDKMPLIGFFT